MRFKNFLIMECVLFFVVFPPVFAAFKPRSWMYAALWIAALLSLLWLYHHKYDINRLWNRQAFTRKALSPVIRLFIPLSVALTLFTYFMIPERLFSFPLERPVQWAMVMVLYPVLSVFPQEIIFRSFFFRRYGPLFSNPKALIAASALAFGWVHILLLNWVAVVFSAIGGVLFSITYNRNRSLALVCFEHAIYGCMVFTLGLGYYFYHGNAVR